MCKNGLAGEALSYFTIYPTLRTPSSLTWVPQSIESSPLLDSKAFSHSSELSYTTDTILPDLGTAE